MVCFGASENSRQIFKFPEFITKQTNKISITHHFNYFGWICIRKIVVKLLNRQRDYMFFNGFFSVYNNNILYIPYITDSSAVQPSIFYEFIGKNSSTNNYNRCSLLFLKI